MKARYSFPLGLAGGLALSERALVVFALGIVVGFALANAADIVRWLGQTIQTWRARAIR